MAAVAICAGRGAVQWYVSSATPVLGLLTRGNFGWNLRRCAIRPRSAEWEGLSHGIIGPSLDSENSLCYRTGPFGGAAFSGA